MSDTFMMKVSGKKFSLVATPLSALPGGSPYLFGYWCCACGAQWDISH